MPWISLGTFSLTENWILTEPVVGEVFRVKHLPISNPDKQYLKAAIVQGFFDGVEFNLFDPRRLTYRSESEVFTFFFPQGIASHALAFKRLDSSNIEWIIEAEVFQGENSDNFSNYIISRFSELMPLFSSRAQDLTVTVRRDRLVASAVSVNVEALTTTTLAGINLERKALSIYNRIDQPILIGLVKKEDGSLDELLAEIPAGGIYELPTSEGSCYQREIYATSSMAGVVSVTEFQVAQS